MLALSSRLQTAFTHLTPSIRRILLHSLLFGLALSIGDLLFNFYLVSLGYGKDTVGLLSTIFRFAAVLAGVPIGMLIDRAGPQRSIQIGLLVFALGWSMQLMMTELWALMISQTIIGMAQILTMTAVVPLLTNVTDDERRPAVFGLNASSGMVIGLLGGTFGGILPSIAASFIQADPKATIAYRLALMAVVGLGLAAITPVLRLIPTTERHRAAQLGSNTPPLTARMLFHFAMPAFSLGIGAGAFLPFQNLFFREQFHLSDAVVGSILAWGSLSMGLGAMSGSLFSRRLGLKRASALLRLLATPAILVMLLPILPISIIGFFLRGAFIGASFPLNDALIMRITPPSQRGTAVSVTSVTWSLGWALTSLVSGWSLQRYGFTSALIIGAVSYVFSALAVMAIPDHLQEANPAYLAPDQNPQK